MSWGVGSARPRASYIFCCLRVCCTAFRDALALLAYLCGSRVRPHGLSRVIRSGGPFGRSRSLSLCVFPAFGLRASRVPLAWPSPSALQAFQSLGVRLASARCSLCSRSRFPGLRSLSRPVSAGRTRVRPCSRPLSFVVLRVSPLAFFFRGCLSRSPPPSPAASPAVLSRRRLRFLRGLVCR